MKTKSFLLIVTLALTCTFALRAQNENPAPATTSTTPSAPPIDPAKDAEIHKLLERTGTIKLANQVMDQMISSFKTQNNGVSDEFWNRFEQEMDTKGLVEKIVPLYDKYYTFEDLKAINAFYETPAGQKVLTTTPLIMHESMQIGQAWGQEVATKLLAELKKEKDSQAPAGGGTVSKPSSN
jgi:hypothetical protein